MTRKRFLVVFLFLALVSVSTIALARKNALRRLDELYQNGPKKGKPLTEQVNRIWGIFYEREPLRWEDSNYQNMMIGVTLDIEEKYGKVWFNPFLIHSFSSMKFLIDELCRRENYDEAIRYCNVIAAFKVEDAADDPVMMYFSRKATDIFKILIAKKGCAKIETMNFLFNTLAYAPYEGADKDSWNILTTLGNKIDAGYYQYLDALAIVYWRLRKELSNNQVEYILNLLEQIDKDKYYNPDFILLVAKDKEYAINLIEKKKFVLINRDIRDIQNDMEECIRTNIFERTDF